MFSFICSSLCVCMCVFVDERKKWCGDRWQSTFYMLWMWLEHFRKADFILWAYTVNSFISCFSSHHPTPLLFLLLLFSTFANLCVFSQPPILPLSLHPSLQFPLDWRITENRTVRFVFGAVLWRQFNTVCGAQDNADPPGLQDPRATWKPSKIILILLGSVAFADEHAFRLTCSSTHRLCSFRLMASQSGREGFNMCQSQTCVLFWCNTAIKQTTHTTTHTHTITHLQQKYHTQIHGHMNSAAQNSRIISWMFKQLSRTNENETNADGLNEIILGSILK